MWWVKGKHQLRIRDTSQDRQPEVQSSLVREDFPRIMVQTNNDCKFSDPHLDKFPTSAHVCLLEDKIQDWGMYLLTISYGSYAVDQRSGDGWKSGWSNIFVGNKRNSNAKLWSTRCEDCFSTEPNHPYPVQKKGHSGGINEPKKRTVSLVEDRSPYLNYECFWVSGKWLCREFCPLTYNCSLKWWYSGIRFEMGRNSFSLTKIPFDDILEGLYRLRIRESEKVKTVLELCDLGDSSEEIRTWLSQIQNYGEEKFRARETK